MPKRHITINFYAQGGMYMYSTIEETYIVYKRKRGKDGEYILCSIIVVEVHVLLCIYTL